MLNFLNTYTFIKGKSAIGVEFLYNTKDSFTLIAQELQEKNGGIEVNNRWVDISLEELAKINTKKLPVYVSIGGKGIIHKKVKYNEYTQEQELLSQVLPNAMIKDFYIQKTTVLNNECWVSVIRKDMLDALVENIKSLQLFCVQVFLGPFILGNILDYVEQPVIKTTTYELIIEKNHVSQMDSLGSVSEGEEYNIEGETVNSHELVAFSSALNHFIPSKNIESISCNELNLMEEEFYYKNKYVFLGFSILVFFFIITIGNMLLNNSYQEVNNNLQYQVNSNTRFIDELRTLKEMLVIKEEFVKNSGVTKAAKIAFYADQIAMSIPNSIILTQLFINPLEKRIKKSEDIVFKFNTIRVSGTVSNSIELNQWIKEVKKMKWINDINVISFIQENIKTAGEFEIEININ